MLRNTADMTTQYIFDSSFRQVSNLFGFDLLKLHKLDIRWLESTYSTE